MSSVLDLRWSDGTLRLSGEMDASNAQLLDAALAHRRPLPTELVLDLSGLEFLDSSGVYAILRAFGALPNGVGMAVRNPSRAARRVLDLLAVAQTGIGIRVVTDMSAASC